MAGLWRGVSGLWGGTAGLWRGISGLWGGASGLEGGGGGPPAARIVLTGNTVPENATIGTVIGALSVAGGTAAGPFSIVSQTPAGKTSIVGSNLQTAAALDYETDPFLAINVTDTAISNYVAVSVLNVPEVTLGALTLSATTWTLGTPANGTINGASAAPPASTITAAGLPAGLTIDGAARTWAWSGSGTVSTPSFTLTETHVDATNSPRNTTINGTIAEGGGGGGLPPPTLDFNFISSTTLDPRITASGGANGTRVNSSGNIVAAVAPRYDYDPVTMAPRGVLIEKARTNALTQSNRPDLAPWELGALGVTVNATAAPDGTATAVKLVPSTAFADHRSISGFYSQGAVEVRTSSIYLKYAGYQWIDLSVWSDEGGIIGFGAVFDLLTGEGEFSFGEGTFAIVDAGNGWFRASVSSRGTDAGSTTGRFYVRILSPDKDQTFEGDGVSGAYVWGAQNETGGVATSLIPTTTAPVTCTADSLTATGTNFSSWYTAGPGTIAAEGDVTLSTSVQLSQMDDGTDSNYLSVHASATGEYSTVVVGGALQFQQVQNVPATAPTGTAFGYAVASAAFSVNGAAAQTSTGPAGLPTANMLRLGRSVGGGSQINGHLRRFRYWNTRLTDAELALASVVSTPSLTGFNASFNTTNLVYDEDDRLVYRTDDITRRAVRGKTGHTSGKWYVELMPLVTRLRFAGVVDSHYNTVGAGTPPGVGRVGILGNELVAYPAVAIPLGQFASPGTVVRIAWDADADLLWLKLDNDDWNDNPLADPVTGIGGLSTAGLDGPGYVGATLRPVSGASVRYRLPGDLGYSLPSGYEEWST